MERIYTYKFRLYPNENSCYTIDHSYNAEAMNELEVL